MEQTIILDSELTATVEAETIRLMEANGLAIWHTPGAGECYIAASAQFTHDVCVATVRDVIDAVGVDDIDEVGDDDYAKLFIWI